MSDHILVFIKAGNCAPCVILSSSIEGIMSSLRKIYPKLRMDTIEFPTKENIIIDTNRINIGIKRFIVGPVPIILLIEGSEWDKSLFDTKTEYKFKNLRYFGKKWTEKFGIVSLEDEYLPGLLGRPTFRNTKHLSIWLSECLKNKNVFPGADIYEIGANGTNLTNGQTNTQINNEILDMIPKFGVDYNEYDKKDDTKVNKSTNINTNLYNTSDYCPVFTIIGVNNLKNNKIFKK